MEDTSNLTDPMFDRIEKYGKTSLELLKLKAIDKTADIVSTLASRGMIILALSIFALIANIGVALWLGDLLGRAYYGFFIVSGFYALFALILYVFRDKWIKTPLQNSIIIQLLN